MRDGQEAHQGAVLKEIQDFSLVRETPKDDQRVRMREEVQIYTSLAVLVKVLNDLMFNTKYILTFSF